jgi:acyl-[acyl-carrier-protein]-phospholipid O-acyltransferase / long-chain-fatty-acid--[acyl-carrier-protein] ligase
MLSIFKTRGFSAYLIMAFLNAFMDLGHKIVIQNAVFKFYDGTTQIVLTSILNAFILLPMVLLFSPTGFTSDKYSKAFVMKISAAAAVPLTVFITISYYLGWFEAAYMLTLLLGVQAAFYGPAKYGYIKELVGNEQIAVGNSYIQTVTIIGILFGTLAFSVFFEMMIPPNFASIHDILQSIAPLGFILIACSTLEFLLSLRLTNTRETDSTLRFDSKKYVSFFYLRENLAIARRTEGIWLSIVGLAVFWGVNQVVLAVFPEFLKNEIGIHDSRIASGLLALGGLGIMVGSMFAGKVSKNFIENGIVPVGAIGITVSLFIVPTTTNIWWLALLFFEYGVMGGLFIIPLNSLIQFNAGKQELGKVLAANGFLQNLLCLIFLLLTALIAGFNSTGFLPFEITSKSIFYALSVVALLGTGYTLYKIPQSFIRYLLGFILSQRYKLSVLGLNNLPATGGVLLLGNHASYLDWAMIQLACPRPIRFVMYRGIYQTPVLKWFLDLFKVVPISSSASSEAIRTIQDMLKQGEIVALFPEGRVSRNGQLATFQRGFELALKDTDAVIVPFYMQGLWGTAFSYTSKKYRQSAVSRRSRKITVAFGEVMPKTSSAFQVKQAVTRLSIQTWHAYSDTLPPVHLSWLRTAKASGGDISAVNFDNTEFSHTRMLAAVMLFSKRIAQLTKGEQNVGILLPAGTGGAIANLAVMGIGKAVVNLNYTASKESLEYALSAANINSIFTSKLFLQKLEQRGIKMTEIFAGKKIYMMEDLRAEFSKLRFLAAILTLKVLPSFLLAALYFKRVPLDQTAAILFSSGSEGLPKGVELTHRNIVGNIKQISALLNPNEDDVILSSLPLFHAFGLTVTTLMPLVEGIKFVCQPDPTDAVAVGKQVAKHKVSLMCGTSTFLGLYARNPKISPLMFETVRLVISGAEKLNESVRKSFREKFGITIYEGFGTTETTPVASTNVPDALSTDDWVVQVGNKEGTVGLPLPGSAFKIVDPETMAELPATEAGLILVSGPQLMKGYLNDEKKTQSVFVELDGLRWYKTGDKGQLDEDGFLKILDRYSRFAKIGGEMISLSAVEAAARNAIPDKEIEIVVTALADESKGEKLVMLFANTKLDAETIKKSLLDSGMNPLMIPKTLLPVEQIPKLGSGKLDLSGAKKLAQSLTAKVETV